jgi:glycosyltransferase involved in cell wall biosynthesis
MSNPAVSVLMSVYNCAAYLADAVRSILAQTFRDFEFLIVDDGSTDRSGPLLAEFAAADERIRLVSRPNTGITRALNEMIERSNGKYLARMDADDIAVPHRFARQVEYLDAHPECVCVGSRVLLIDPYGSPVAETAHNLAHEAIDHELLTDSGWAMVHPTVMMRRDAVVAVGGYNERWKHCEDHDLFLRLAERGKVANLPDVLLRYRRHYGSINYTGASEQAAQKETLLREAHTRRGLEMPVGWKLKPWMPIRRPEQSRLWGWAALKAGNLRVARRHALTALRAAPANVDAWRLLYCAVRGR